jgi:hypothetical protein
MPSRGGGRALRYNICDEPAGLETDVELDELGFGDVSLIDGERIDSAINLGDRLKDDPAGYREAVLLTDQRVIHLNANGRRRKAVFVSLRDIDAVEIVTERLGGYGALVWGGLAFFIAIALWRVWDNPWGSALAALAVASMGVYLIVDRFTSPDTIQATFRAGSSQIQCSLKGDRASMDIYAFVNRLHQLRAEGGRNGTRFPPRYEGHAPPPSSAMDV